MLRSAKVLKLGIGLLLVELSNSNYPFMMYLRLELSWLLLMTIGVHAGPLHWGQVSDDAQWVAHFDFEGLRQTSLYKEVSEQLLQQYISEAETEIKRSSGIDMTIDSVLSVTAFGKSANKAPDEDGILMLEITPTLKTIAMDWLWNSHGAKPNELPVSVSKIDAEIEYLYSIDGEILIAADTDSNHLCIGRNKELIIHFIHRHDSYYLYHTPGVPLIIPLQKIVIITNAEYNKAVGYATKNRCALILHPRSNNLALAVVHQTIVNTANTIPQTPNL